MTADEEPPAPAIEDNAADAEQKPERKQFVKRLPRPDQAELRAKVESLEATITAQKQRVESIRSELDGRNRRRANDTESQGIRNQLQELRTQFQQVLVRALLPPYQCCRDRRCSSFMPTRVRSDHDYMATACKGLYWACMLQMLLIVQLLTVRCVASACAYRCTWCCTLDTMLRKHVAKMLLLCLGRVRSEPWALLLSLRVL